MVDSGDYSCTIELYSQLQGEHMILLPSEQKAIQLVKRIGVSAAKLRLLELDSQAEDYLNQAKRHGWSGDALNAFDMLSPDERDLWRALKTGINLVEGDKCALARVQLRARLASLNEARKRC